MFNITPETLEFMGRILLDSVAIFIVARLIYYPRHKNKDFLFTFFLFNIVNFLICFFLRQSTIEMGFAFGLFAIFSIIRYRTVTVPIKEMGYFFVSVALALIVSLAPIATPLFIAIGILIGLVFILDRESALLHENFQDIQYEKINLIQPTERAALMADLHTRIGIDFHRVEVRKVDFFRDTALLRAYYYSDKNESDMMSGE